MEIDGLYHLVQKVSEYKKLDFSKQEDIEEFFGDEDFSEYMDILNG